MKDITNDRFTIKDVGQMDVPCRLARYPAEMYYWCVYRFTNIYIFCA